MRKMYVFQHRDYGASWFDEDTCEEIGGVSDSDIVVPIEDAEKLCAEIARLREALSELYEWAETSPVPRDVLQRARETLKQTGGQDDK